MFNSLVEKLTESNQSLPSEEELIQRVSDEYFEQNGERFFFMESWKILRPFKHWRNWRRPKKNGGDVVLATPVNGAAAAAAAAAGLIVTDMNEVVGGNKHSRDEGSLDLMENHMALEKEPAEPSPSRNNTCDDTSLRISKETNHDGQTRILSAAVATSILSSQNRLEQNSQSQSQQRQLQGQRQPLHRHSEPRQQGEKSGQDLVHRALQSLAASVDPPLPPRGHVQGGRNSSQDLPQSGPVSSKRQCVSDVRHHNNGRRLQDDKVAPLSGTSASDENVDLFRVISQLVTTIQQQNAVLWQQTDILAHQSMVQLFEKPIEQIPEHARRYYQLRRERVLNDMERSNWAAASNIGSSSNIPHSVRTHRPTSLQ